MEMCTGDPSGRDVSLHRAVVAGSASAMGELFETYAGEVFAYYVRRCGDRAAAEDLLSVVFLEAWRCHERAVLVDSSLRPWLYGIAHNVLRNAARATRRHRAALERYHAANPDLAGPDHADDVATAVDVLGVSASVRAAFARLPRRQRDVAELCLVADLSTSQAATVLGASKTAVASRLARARRELQRLIRSGESPIPAPRTGHEQGERRTGAPGKERQPSWTS